jgi:hypothetical protein
MKENQAEKTFERSKQKKHTFQKNNNKFDFKKSFDQMNKPKKQRYYSTKIIINFVPQIKPKKSFCKPTFFQLNKDENNNENDRSFELDKISSCDEIEDNESIESNESSSSLSSASDTENNKEENTDSNKKENGEELKFTLDGSNKEISQPKISSENILSSLKRKESSNADEYEHLAYKKKKTMNETEDKGKNSIKNLRKEMLKIRKSKTVIIKSKETEEIMHDNINGLNLGHKNFMLDPYDEKENLKENNVENKKINHLIDKKFISNNNVSILDILSINNKKNCS